MSIVDQNRGDSLSDSKTVFQDVCGGADMLTVGRFEMPSRAYIGRFNFKGQDQQKRVGELSGGERNRLQLAKILQMGANVILLDEPTRGIDVGAKNEIYNVIYDLAKVGIAVVVVSSELPEVLGIADRILVMREGEIAGELSHDEANEVKALNLAMPAR